MFSGYSQQDSQELLQSLLDGLHEDLNRIKVKPYVEVPEMDGSPDFLIAQKSWEIYSLRNDSIIVDLFQGQYKSRVECIQCGKWSIKFDPYMFLSLPVPERREIMVKLVAVPAHRGNIVRPSSIQVCVPRDASIKMLKEAAVKVLGWSCHPTKETFMAEVFSGKIYKKFNDYERASAIQSMDVVYFIEMGDFSHNWHGMLEGVVSPCQVPVYLFSPTISAESSYQRISQSETPFGLPLFVTLPQKISTKSSSRMLFLTLIEAALGTGVYHEIVREIQRYSKICLFRRIGDSSDLVLPESSESDVVTTPVGTDQSAETLASTNGIIIPEVPDLNDPNFEPFPNICSMKYFAGQKRRYLSEFSSIYSHWGGSADAISLYPLPSPSNIITEETAMEPVDADNQDGEIVLPTECLFTIEFAPGVAEKLFGAKMNNFEVCFLSYSF